MLDKRNFELEHTRELQEKYRRDPALLERVLFAFGLLDALVQVELPFVFRGGTCLILLLSKPFRLSTDIDITVAPGTDIDDYINKAAEIFPFISLEEQIRIGKNKIEKRHFKFKYRSPLMKREFYVLLDVLYAEMPYSKVIQQEVKNDLILTSGQKSIVTVPELSCLLGDKLTAFAPHTTGILLGVGKELEIIKQLFDIAVIFDEVDDFDLLSDVYQRTVLEELSYRGLALSSEAVLSDSINAAVCIISRGVLNKAEYAEYLFGIKGIGSHVLTMKYSGEIASNQACKILYIASCLLSGTKVRKIANHENYLEQKIDSIKYRKLSYMKKQSIEAYSYLFEAIQMLDK